MQTIIDGNGLKILARIMQGPPPTWRQLMALTGISNPSGVHYHLKRLMRLGLVGWEPAKYATLHPRVRFIPAEEIP